MTESKSTFIWKIPAFTKEEIGHICNGYIRIESNEYVPKDVVNLCMDYYTNDLKLNGSLSPKEMAKFKSDMFEYEGIKFYMTFDKTDSIGKSKWNIIIPYLPQNTSKISINCRTSVTYKKTAISMESKNNKTLDTKYSAYDQVHSKEFANAASNEENTHKPMEINNAFDLFDMRYGIYSFELIFHDLKQYDIDEQLIQKTEKEDTTDCDNKQDEVQYIRDNLVFSSGGHIWYIEDEKTLKHIKKAEPGSFFVSSLFAIEQFKWLMKLSYYDDISYGSSTDFCLYLTSLSPKIKQLCIRYKLWIVELNKLIDATYIFKPHSRSCWKLDIFHVDEVQKLDKITMNIEIAILDIFYEKKDDEKNVMIPITPSLKTLNGLYEWKVINPEIVNKIKRVATGIDFCSEIFELGGAFKFYLKFYPNGYSESYTGSTDLFLRMASVPPNISQVSASYQLILEEKNTRHFTVSQFSSKSASFGWNKLKNTDIQDIDAFTFKAIISIIEVFDKDGNVVTPQYMKDENDNNDDMKEIEDEKDEFTEMPLAKMLGGISHYKWKIEDVDMLDKIKNALNGEHFESHIFTINKLQWMIKIFPNGDDVEDKGNGDILVYLVSLSPKLKGMCVFYKMRLLELDVSKNSTVGLTHTRMRWWTENMWKFEDIQSEDIKSLTFQLEIGILDIFDKNGNCINDQYDDIFKDAVDVNMNNNDKKMDNVYRYKWEIKDALKIKEIKESTQTVSFKSGYYSLNKVKLFMHFLPNNEVKDVGEEIDDIGKTKYCSFGFTLCSMPPNIFSMTLKFILRLKETQSEFMNIDQCSNEYNIVNWNLNPKLFKSDIKDLDQFTFEAIITIIEVYDKNGNNMTSQYIDDDGKEEKEEKEEKYIDAININKISYEWKINDKQTIDEIKQATNGKHFMSPIFKINSFKWFLQFIPSPAKRDEIVEEKKEDDGTSLFISLASLSPNIAYISMHYELLLKETNSRHQYCTQLTNKLGDMAVSWRTSTLHRSKILNLNEFTFTVVIAVIDVYDKDNNNITHQFKDELDDEKIDINISRNVGFAASDIYKWYVNDLQTIQTIKNAKNGEFIMSEMFKMHGLKWKIQICPNGSTPKRDGIFNWYFIMISLPPSISKIALFYKILLIETNTTDEDLIEMQYDGTLWGWGQKKLKHQEIQNLNQFTFELEIKIIDIFDNNGNRIDITKDIDKKIIYPIYDNNIFNEKLQEFVWKIEDIRIMNKIKTSKIGECVRSEYINIYGHDWFLSFFPSGKTEKERYESKLYVNLKILPENISGISFYFELYIKETNTSFNNYAHFRSDYLTRSWETTRIKITQIQQLNTLTFTMKIKIVDIFPK